MEAQNFKNTLVINSEFMGENREIGIKLMQAAIHTLCDIVSKPSKIIFYNSGVKVFENSDSIYADLKYLHSIGIEFILCKTCIDFFNIESYIGNVSNMFDILSIISESEKVVYL